jgi:Ca2+-binding EF-hand superfamily protein
MEDNPGGTLGKRKMMEMYQAVLSEEKARVFVDQIFTKFDTDNSGEIDFKGS